MRGLMLAIVSVSALFAMVTPAAADPASIGTLVITGINALAGTSIAASTSVFGLTTLGSLIGAATLTGLAIGASALFGTGKPNINPTDAKKTFTAEEGPVINAVGRVKLGGLKIYGNTNGYNRYRLIGHCDGVVVAVEAYWLGGREIIVDQATGQVTSPPYAYSGGSNAYIWDKPGDGTETSWPQLEGDFPTLWTSAHRCRGIGQSLCKFISPGISNSRFLKLFSGGVPDLQKVMRVGILYDPRTNSWGWTDNGILVAYHVAMLDQKLTLSAFDIDVMKAEADKADVLVATKTGVEPRARAWGTWVADGTNRSTVLQDVLDSIGAEQFNINGKIGFRLIDYVRTAEVSIDPKHMVSGQDQDGPESVSRPNVAVIRYYSPERNYSLSEIDMTGIAWARVDSEIASTGVQQLSIDLKFCPSASQAQRVACLKFALARAPKGTLTTNFAGLAVWNCKMADLPDPAGDLVLSAIDAPEVNDVDGTVKIAYTEWPTLPTWDPSTMEAVPPASIPDIPVDSALPTPSAPTRTIQINYPDGTHEVRTAYNVTSPVANGQGISESIDTVETTIRIYSGATPGPWTSMTEIGVVGNCIAYTAGSYLGQGADTRLRVFSGDDASNWSNLFNATIAVGSATPATPSVIFVGNEGSARYAQVTAPNTLDVAYMTIAATGLSTVTVNCRPGQIFSYTSITSGTVTATPYNSNNVAGPSSSATY